MKMPISEVSLYKIMKISYINTGFDSSGELFSNKYRHYGYSIKKTAYNYFK